nr:MAG TPA: hypothetical protein [Bacteriophage sp.]
MSFFFHYSFFCFTFIGSSRLRIYKGAYAPDSRWEFPVKKNKYVLFVFI